MVQRVMRRVRKVLGSSAPNPVPLVKLERKLLVIIQFHGKTVMLQNESFKHQHGRHFDAEAVALFQESFGFGPQVSAVNSGTFVHRGVEWHVVRLPVKDIFLTLLPVLEDKAKENGALLMSVEDHPFYERYLKRHV